MIVICLITCVKETGHAFTRFFVLLNEFVKTDCLYLFIMLNP